MSSSEGGGPGGGQDYFNSYCDLNVHELMLQDRPRTTFYRKFFETHRDFVKGKVVMDVGAGTGILSLFAATAGAKAVYAVEASEVASLCEEIVKDNNLESVITVIKGAVEDISLPGDIKVDVIVSEWMGFYLLHESMLDSVLFAADKFLAPSGVLVPSRASIYMAPVDMSQHFEDRAEYWSNIYGYDFSPIASTMNLQEVSKPLIKTIPKSYVKAEAVKILDLDLKTAKVDDVKSFSELCKFPMTEESRIHGFAAWFEVSFDLELVESSSSSSSKSNDGKNNINEQKTNNNSNRSSSECEMEVEDGHANLNGNGNNSSVVNGAGDAKKTKISTTVVSESDNIDSSNKNINNKTISSCSSAVSEAKSKSTPSVFSLSTGPESLATHWKQTIIFLPQTIMVCDDLVLCCMVKMKQDAGNKRHYNISLELMDEMDLGGFGGDSDDINNDIAGAASSSDDEKDEEGSDEGEEEEEHPVPCNCGSDRCRLIAVLVEKYDTEHQELEDEAVIVETKAEVEAAKEIDQAIESEGWSLDTSGTTTTTTDNTNTCNTNVDKPPS